MKKILTFPNPILETKCVYVDTKAPRHELKQVQRVIRDLELVAANHYAECLGLSANQLGFNLRIFVMRQEGGPFFHVVNPILVAKGGGVKSLKERCLSRVDEQGNLLPGIAVRRPKWIKVECFTMHDLEFRKETFELKGIDARVFLHELDHLNGVVI